MREIYLDNAATTKPLPEVVETINEYLTDKWFNPSAKYKPAQEVKRCLYEARKTVADFIGAKPEEIYFTSGASEANNWAIKGYLEKEHSRMLPFVTTAIEHKSILSIAEYYGCMTRVLEPGRYTGEIVLDSVTTATFLPNPIVSVQWANNEIGVIQDVELMASVCHNRDIVFHTDATQAFPHIKIDMSQNEIDMMSVSGHKFGAPKGIGFLYIRNRCKDKIVPLISGAQENGMRGGTENIPYIMGMAKAISMLKPKNQCNLAEYFELQLVNELGCRINGSPNKLKHIISCTFPEYVVGEYLIYRLADYGIYLSAGSACNSYANTPSTVLDAIGLTHDEIARTARISLSEDTTREDVDYTIEMMNKICYQFKL